jgi:putative peptide zinc metalloprotease protein
MERPTFSQNWSRVNRLTPTLRPHVQMTRQLFRGEHWYVVHDPISNNFFRLNPVAHHFVGLLDGKRTVDEAWHLTTDRYADMAPTQNEVIQILGQLNQSNLLRVDLPVDAKPLLDRANRRKVKQWTGQAMSILFVRIPLINPDRFLTWALPLFRPILSKGGLALWTVWLFYCLWQFLPHASSFLHDAESVLAPANWGWMILLFLITKAIHEFGHGITCKRFGGAVPEMGVMMLIMMPAPFVDATSSWSFGSRWHRFLVNAAGMMFELTIAGAAALIWLYEKQNNPGSLSAQLAYNIVFMASFTTVLFNANPLLRFDGYYMLADFLEVPNMYDRATKHTQWLVQRFAYGMENAQPVATAVGEQWILLIYGFASQIYRFFVLTGIILFIAGQLLTIGLLLAAWSFIAWCVVPVCKFFHWLLTSGQLGEQRKRAMAVTFGVIIAFIIGVGVINVDEHKRTEGVIESAQRSDISIASDGFVTQVLVDPGEQVKAGQTLLIAENPQLLARKAELETELLKLDIDRRMAMVKDLVDMSIARAKAVAIQDELDDINDRIADLVLKAPQDGTLIAADFKQFLGQYVRRGDVVGRVADLKQLRVTALVSQSQSAAALSKKIQAIELRTVGNIEKVHQSELIMAFDSGRSYLPHPALSKNAGGQIAMDPQDPKGQKTLRPQFEMWLKLPAEMQENLEPGKLAAAPALLGERVYVRLTLGKRPLFFQWLTFARQMIRDRLHF